ncbi:hypothetical protein Q3G72_015313 [Acer saccharum]|nr:hypothetical protein Q3G72_015313 [Acer saccharum]
MNKKKKKKSQGKKAAVGMIGFIGIMKIHKQCCNKEEIALKREKSLALAFSHQIWRTDGRLAEEIIIGRWATRKQSWDSLDRVSCDQRDPIKTVEIDTFQPYNTAIQNIISNLANPYIHRAYSSPS